VIPQFKYV